MGQGRSDDQAGKGAGACVALPGVAG